MLSRVAESIYWMSRYIERAENVARLIDVNFQLELDFAGNPRTSTDNAWQALITTTGDYDRFDAAYRYPTAENVIEFLVFDRDNPNSILSCLRAARENARTVREVLSSETWEQVNRFYLTVESASREQSGLDLPSEFLQQIRLQSHTIAGVTTSTMSHNEAWHFLRLGLELERAEQTVRLLDTKYFLLLPSPDAVGSTIDDLQWAAVLRSASGFEMYRKRYGRVEPTRVVEFLLLNREFPRSVHHGILAADEALHQIGETDIGTFRNVPERELGRLRWEFAFSDARDIISAGLHEYLDSLQLRFRSIGAAILKTFFERGLPVDFTDRTAGESTGHTAGQTTSETLSQEQIQ